MTSSHKAYSLHNSLEERKSQTASLTACLTVKGELILIQDNKKTVLNCIFEQSKITHKMESK